MKAAVGNSGARKSASVKETSLDAINLRVSHPSLVGGVNFGVNKGVDANAEARRKAESQRMT